MPVYRTGKSRKLSTGEQSKTKAIKSSTGKEPTPKEDDQSWRMVCMQECVHVVPSTPEIKQKGGQCSFGGGQNLVMFSSKRWKKNDIDVFMAHSVHQDRVLQYAKEWSNHCAVQFRKCDNIDESDIRLSFLNTDKNHSFVGTDAQKHPRLATMNLAVVQQYTMGNATENDLRRTVLHEFGHALGLEHAHRCPKTHFQWNRQKILDDFSRGPIRWTKKKIRHNILSNLKETEVESLEWDEKSIMHYGSVQLYRK